MHSCRWTSSVLLVGILFVALRAVEGIPIPFQGYRPEDGLVRAPRSTADDRNFTCPSTLKSVGWHNIVTSSDLYEFRKHLGNKTTEQSAHFRVAYTVRFPRMPVGERTPGKFHIAIVFDVLDPKPAFVFRLREYPRQNRVWLVENAEVTNTDVLGVEAPRKGKLLHTFYSEPNRDGWDKGVYEILVDLNIGMQHLNVAINSDNITQYETTIPFKLPKDRDALLFLHTHVLTSEESKSILESGMLSAESWCELKVDKFVWVPSTVAPTTESDEYY